MQITNFSVRKLDNTNGELNAAKTKWVDSEFIPSASDEYWLATFDINGEKHYAGIRRGRRHDVAEETDQFCVELRVKEEAFEADSFLSEAEVADITRAVGEAFEKGRYWEK